MKRITLGLSLLLAVSVVPAGGQLAPTLNPDQEMERMGLEIPGFGGVYYDADGIPHVFLTDLDQADRVRAYGAEVVFHQGQYEFGELQTWRRDLGALLLLDEVVMLDVDETRNRVVVGVDPAKFDLGRDAVKRQLAQAGIPPASVVIEPQDPIYPMNHNVQDTFPTVPGGVEIGFGPFVCTLGFNVAFSDAVVGYVTNSHCTLVQGGVEGTVHAQNFFGPILGVEVLDPLYGAIPGCPAGAVCRLSDSSLGLYDDPTRAELGTIARTTFSGQFLGSLVINGANPRFNIVATAGTANGQRIHKVGRTTGWTRGPQQQTCVNVGVTGTNIVLLCQNTVNAGVGGGDSGSPVFRRREDGSGVALVGLLWGGNGPGTLFVYSPISAVCTELFGAPC